jgi:hypothetical protein
VLLGVFVGVCVLVGVTVGVSVVVGVGVSVGVCVGVGLGHSGHKPLAHPSSNGPSNVVSSNSVYVPVSLVTT